MQWARHVDATLHSLAAAALVAAVTGALCASSVDVAAAPAVLVRCVVGVAIVGAPWSLQPLAQARRVLGHARAGGALSALILHACTAACLVTLLTRPPRLCAARWD